MLVAVVVWSVANLRAIPVEIAKVSLGGTIVRVVLQYGVWIDTVRLG